jgi:hypothetical protein
MASAKGSAQEPQNLVKDVTWPKIVERQSSIPAAPMALRLTPGSVIM